ncbi:MAG: hypothetical protein MJE68_33640, partial [Proteobacteria bacterium]|nr:hypothetical protein [Pseudomonadota bacterium]
DYDPIPWEECVAERRKNPEYRKAYEAVKPEFERLERQIVARKARRARRRALVKRVRGFWASLLRGITRLVKQPLRG